ncbi:MAG TPA: tRNA uridine-5-carboxymethylaminomethyl(34) synthesis GTPase MnmE [Gammaproteobacteria bacterium]|nr:tRNA uridine-5-carboxymethylaminomethyl(34) synthesis GTPase MnmE [Gammaproteobacteria bacterium]
MKKHSETIVATATPPGRGGVAVVRVSGPRVKAVCKQVLKKIPNARYAIYSSFFDEAGKAIDQGIALYFPNPHSFTGEDVLELHGHGGPVILDCLIRRILQLGARLARPGEFSERAFLNDKMDLTQAEAIADLIDAASEQAARNALQSLQGEFSKKIHALVEALIELRLYVEASIDFVEEEIDFLNSEAVDLKLHHILCDLEMIQASAKQGSLLRDGITAVIAGQPNVGKSSLLNQLSGKDVAIVTDIPGTTRDVLRESIVMDGMPIHIIDTAGLRESDDPIEQEGIRRAFDEIEKADLILFVVDASRHDPVFLSDFLQKLPPHATLMTIRNKIDLTTENPGVFHDDKNSLTISLSAKNGSGIESLRQWIRHSVGYDTQCEGTFSARRRHLDALSRAKDFLLHGQKQLTEHRAGELLAEDLRLAQNTLSEITGEFTSDDLLGRIFGSFCIGK